VVSIHGKGSFIINQNGMIQSFRYINKSKEPISNFYFEKKKFFLNRFAARVARQAMKTTYHTITF